MHAALRKLLLLISAAFFIAGGLAACGGGGGDEDPDFDGPAWEGDCPSAADMKRLRPQYAANGWPEPPYAEYCPAEYAESLK